LISSYKLLWHTGQVGSCVVKIMISNLLVLAWVCVCRQRRRLRSPGPDNSQTRRSHYVTLCLHYAPPIYMVLMLMLILKSQASKQIFWCCFKWSSCSSNIHSSSTKVVRVAPLHIPPLAYYKYNRQTVLNIWAQKTSMVIRIPGVLPTSATAPRTSTAMLYHRVTNYFSLQLPQSFTSSILHGHLHS